MAETSFSNINIDYYNSNKKIYSKNNFCCKLSNVEKFDADRFAEWMQDHFEKSSYKTITALAVAVKSNKATISRLMTAAPQTTTNKRSQPNKDLVKKLALVFGVNVDETLMLAGYAPENAAIDNYDILDGATVSFDERKFSKKEQKELLDAMKLIAAGVLAQKEAEE